MAKLLSHHDPKRIHATTGLLALVHFVYRGVLFARTGSSFPTWEPRWAGIGGACIHLVLHATSFIPPLPEKRIMAKPMIWPEFRVHNAIFGCRHALATVAALVARDVDVPFFVQLGIVAAFVFGPSAIATWASRVYGDPVNRTTNSMAYPPNVAEGERQNTKKWYANAQFGATFMCTTLSPTCCFWPVLAIELSPFMMTLVRKNLASTTSYHRVYTLALLVPYFILTRAFLAQLGRSTPEPEMLTPYLGLGMISACLAPPLRRAGASKPLALSTFILAFVLARLGPLNRLFLKSLVASVVGGLLFTPFNEARWMCVPTRTNPSRTPIQVSG